MAVGTGVVCTVASEEVDIAELHVSYFVYHLFVVNNGRINALETPVARYLFTSCRMRGSWLWCWRRRGQLSGRDSRGSPTSGFGVHNRSVAGCGTRMRAVRDRLIRRLIDTLRKRCSRTIRSCSHCLICRRQGCGVLYGAIDVYFPGAEQFAKPDTRVLILQKLELPLEWYSLKKCNAAGETWLCILLEQACVSVVVRTAEEDMVAAVITQLKFEELYKRSVSSPVVVARRTVPVIFSSALSFPGPTSTKSKSTLLPVNPR